jgi:hypothetical protein
VFLFLGVPCEAAGAVLARVRARMDAHLAVARSSDARRDAK